MDNEKGDTPRPLTEHEKTVIRDQLRAFMREHPARAPIWMRVLDVLQGAGFGPRLQFVTATLGLLLITGSGTAFAAQNALPGDPLYGIKVNVEEPILGSLALSPEAKANWSAELTARRLSEAEQLAEQNKLTPAAAATIAGGLDQATENFDANVSALATSTGNAATVATLASNMEATLAANTQALNEIADIVPRSATEIRPILSSVQERTISLNSARTAMDVTAAQTNGEQVQLAAQTQFGDAQDQVAQAIANARTASSSTSSSSVLQAQQAQQELDSGKQDLGSGDYVAALENFQAASVNAHAAQLNVFINAQLGVSQDATDTATSATTSVRSMDDTATSTSTTTPRALYRTARERRAQDPSVQL